MQTTDNLSPLSVYNVQANHGAYVQKPSSTMVTATNGSQVKPETVSDDACKMCLFAVSAQPAELIV